MKTILAVLLLASTTSCTLTVNSDGSKEANIDGVQAARFITHIISTK